MKTMFEIKDDNLLPSWKIRLMRLMFWKYRHCKIEESGYHFEFLSEKKGNRIILIKQEKQC